jgi:hypothetical protein
LTALLEYEYRENAEGNKKQSNMNVIKKSEVKGRNQKNTSVLFWF